MRQVCAYVTPIVARGGRFDGGVYDLDGASIETAVHRRGGADNVHRPTPAPMGDIGLAPTDDEPHGYVGLVFNHFGHVLIESLGRLWAARTDEGKALK